MKIATICDLCGVTFGRYPSRVRAGLAFCSGVCRMRSYADPRIAAMNAARIAAQSGARRAFRPRSERRQLDAELRECEADRPSDFTRAAQEAIDAHLPEERLAEMDALAWLVSRAAAIAEADDGQ